MLVRDVRQGLGVRPRRLSPKYLYDAEGSRIYEEITRLPEYYPFRTEKKILLDQAAAIVEASCPQVVVEFGSGAAEKTRILLDEMDERGLLEGYGAVEVSGSALRRSLESLASAYPDIVCRGLLADFNAGVSLPFAGERRLLMFLGSTIGNLAERPAQRFLEGVAEAMDDRDRFLVGFDLVKDIDVIEAAYDDRQGVTARFNLNLLRRLNRELDGDFDLARFRHRAFFNAQESRIEMHLESQGPQTVTLSAADLSFDLEAGETIRTEISRKFTREQVQDMTVRAGLIMESWATDERGYFAVALLRRATTDGEGSQ